ncbi:MAG: hypothetical protein AB1644_06210 [Candidatus Zixiibacteriota bacterium]
MNRANTLKSLEIVLESFLERAVNLKEERLRVLDGINRLDDIALGFLGGKDLTDDIGGWFAEHTQWLNESGLRPADRNRIGEILGSIKSELHSDPEVSPAQSKIRGEIERWNETVSKGTQKLVLKRGPEAPPVAPIHPPDADSITLFANTLTRLAGIFSDHAMLRQHIMSILDDMLRSAKLQQNKDALLLSAFMIYYLKQNNYKVEPYVKRLKEAEAGIRGERIDA